MTVNDYTAMISETQEQIRIIKQTSSLLSKSQFSGAEAKDVAQSMGYLRSLVQALESNLESLKKEREEAKKNLPPLDPQEKIAAPAPSPSGDSQVQGG